MGEEQQPGLKEENEALTEVTYMQGCVVVSRRWL